VEWVKGKCHETDGCEELEYFHWNLPQPADLKLKGVGLHVL
jgi:hypothetical protein